jgi:hypothetical protein
MFSFFKRKPSSPPASGIPRGVLPTYVTNDSAVLSKAAKTIRNTYEIRLALYMAKSKGLRFVLAVPPNAELDTSIASLFQEHGGEVQHGQFADYCVYFGHERPDGSEEGWVLGDAAAMKGLAAAFRSQYLRENLRPGVKLSGTDLDEIEKALRDEHIDFKNIDGEDVRIALLDLTKAAKQSGGSLFVQ